MGHRQTVALTIAGSDSGGGAGIQADLKTFQAFEVFGTSVVTAITAQNTLGVSAVHTVPSEIVRAQIRAVLDDLRPSAVKTGMLGTREVVADVADALNTGGPDLYVLDPVMVATSGDRLLDAGAESALASDLLPLATLITPNLHEAEILTGIEAQTVADMQRAAEALVESGARAALIKGGHLPGPQAIDLLWDGRRERIWRRERIRSDQTHGTGCTLSAGITACLTQGDSLVQAVDRAIDFVARALAGAPGLGEGRGPLNHLVIPKGRPGAEPGAG